MTFHTGPAVVPQLGGFYECRAGLRVFVNGLSFAGGVPRWTGVFVGEATGPVTWYANGQYAPMPNYRHELDIMLLTA